MILELPSAIDTRQLRVRLVRESDIEDLLDINGDNEVTRFLPYDSWRSLAEGKIWYERMCSIVATGEALQFVIVKRELTRVVGSCLLFRYNRESATAELGYVMGQEHWKNDYTHEALSGLLSYAFRKYKLRSIKAVVDNDNIESSNLLLKLGFTHEGRSRQTGLTLDSNYDTNNYGLLREEWMVDGDE
jgi:ribosomal-protein-alanine N-acetyltransferase